METKDRDIVIAAENVAKEYRYYRNNAQRMGHELLRRDAGEKVTALRDVSFEIARGEKVAIIGVLGSGRSTIMKLLAGIIRPDSGTVRVQGEITTVFDHKMAFDSAFSVTDNIHLRASIMGWSRRTAAEHEKSIIEFCGIDELKDQPFRNYPAGAPTRVGFAMETEFKPEIMLYDESFSFGGRIESAKCVDRLEELISGEDSTFVMVCNNVKIAKRLCSRGLVLEDGEIVFDGTITKALKYYTANCKPDPDAEKRMKDRTDESAADDTEDIQDDF